MILNDGSEMPEKICNQRPVGVRHNAVFVISLEKVNMQDLTADDNGSWEVCSPRRKYNVERDSSTGYVLSVKEAVKDADNVYTLIRQYGTHIALTKEKGVEFKCIISTLKDPNDTYQF